MKMTEFAHTLRSSLENATINFGSKADSVLSFLCDAYYDQNCSIESDEIRQAFVELYKVMSGKTLREMDEILYPVCALCRSHQLSGFIDGLRLGFFLSLELNQK